MNSSNERIVIDPDKGGWKKILAFLAFLAIIIIAVVIITWNSSDNSEGPVQQNTEQTAPAPTSQWLEHIDT